MRLQGRSAIYCLLLLSEKKKVIIQLILIWLHFVLLIFINMWSTYCYLLARQRLHKVLSHEQHSPWKRWQVSCFHLRVACSHKHSKLSCNIVYNVSTECHIAVLPKDITLPHQCCTSVFAVVYTVNSYWHILSFLYPSVGFKWGHSKDVTDIAAKTLFMTFIWRKTPLPDIGDLQQKRAHKIAHTFLFWKVPKERLALWMCYSEKKMLLLFFFPYVCCCSWLHCPENWSWLFWHNSLLHF